MLVGKGVLRRGQMNIACTAIMENFKKSSSEYLAAGIQVLKRRLAAIEGCMLLDTSRVHLSDK